MTDPSFVAAYKESGDDYLKSNLFWQIYKISSPQALFDKQYLYGILVTATKSIQLRTILKYENLQDGILAWEEIKARYANDGSDEIRIEHLESLSQVKFNPKTHRSMCTYIDTLQAYLEELSALASNDWPDLRKRHLLLQNIQSASGMTHLVQYCRDNSHMSYDQCAEYIRKNSLLIENANKLAQTSLVHMVESDEIQDPDMSPEQVAKLFHTYATDMGLTATHRLFNIQSFRENLKIPHSIWTQLEPSIRTKIEDIRKSIQEKQASTSAPKSDKKLPAQYPTMKDTVANLMSTMADMGISDGDDTDDEMLHAHAMMVHTRTIPDPSGKSPDASSDELIVNVKAHLEYAQNSWYTNKIYAISDGGADSCIVGKYAHVKHYTGRYANLVGYSPETTRTEKVPIVTALIKVKSSSEGGYPILLEINEAPYNEGSPITLLSEYQIREYGLVIDSVAKKHKSSNNQHGTQRFEVSPWVFINFEDRGGLMGMEILPYEEGDEDRYDTFTITSPKPWKPHRFAGHLENPSQPDPPM